VRWDQRNEERARRAAGANIAVVGVVMEPAAGELVRVVVEVGVTKADGDGVARRSHRERTGAIPPAPEVLKVGESRA
jgi:hypothetical protein